LTSEQLVVSLARKVGGGIEQCSAEIRGAAARADRRQLGTVHAADAVHDVAALAPHVIVHCPALFSVARDG
jgi:hypothetical protein